MNGWKHKARGVVTGEKREQMRYTERRGGTRGGQGGTRGALREQNHGVVVSS